MSSFLVIFLLATATTARPLAFQDSVFLAPRRRPPSTAATTLSASRRRIPFFVSTTRHHTSSSATALASFSSSDEYDDAPSDYDAADLPPDTKQVTVDEREEDAMIRDDLKRELLLLSSVTNRGEYATRDEQDILIDLVTQLEALNPTANPSSNSQGEWDLCLSSTQLFKSSPFFQSIRVAMDEGNKQMALNGFELHDRATTVSRIGRVRQTISPQELVSEVDLEVGILPGIPVRIKGTVITTASLKVVSSDTFETQIQTTRVKGSNVPLLNQWLEDIPQLELPVGEAYKTILQGQVPVVPWKTFYLDEAMRIVRDIDDNFFVFTRA